MHTILFVCTGNTCRSPMAEAIARHLIDQGLLGGEPDVFVASAGVAAANGRPATAEAEAALGQNLDQGSTFESDYPHPGSR